MTEIMDIICQVYAGTKNIKTIYSVLDEFLPEYEKLNLDFACKPDDPNYVFKSEMEMVSYFIDNKKLDQSFYWNQYNNNPDKIMIGAIITADDKIIISLTFDGDESRANYYLRKLKEFLNSDIGVISYVNPADYIDGKDFIEKYK